MKINQILRLNWMINAVFSIVAGFSAFLMVVGPRALHPSNISWLNKGDPATHYLGWLFYRHSEWSLPIGLNKNYGIEISSAILFSDSNPLLAVLFKPFSQFLPDTFQYFGIWLLICFVLQAWYAFKFIELFTTNPLVVSPAACYFIFSPPMIWRLHGHLSLAGHFLILASLYFALHPSPKQRIFKWAILLVVSSFTHAYILAMVSFIWIADIVDRLIKNILPFKCATREFSIVIVVTSFACWQAGYFSIGDGVAADGYGLYRMNLLSIFDPSGWSYALPDIPEASGDYEGFNFLGLGMIFLGICSLPSLLNSKTGIVSSAIKRPILLAALLGLTAFAVSNKLGISSASFELELPDLLMRAANIFRASGRMFWPVFYMIFFTIIFLITRGYNNRSTIILLWLGLVIQIVDTSKGWLTIRSELMTKPSSVWQTKMVDPFWNEAASKYRKVRWMIPTNHSTSWKEVASYAGTHNLATDAVYLARVGKENLRTAQQKAKTTLQSGVFDSDSLYILEKGLLRQVAMNLDIENNLLAKIDGFTVLAPGWKKCTTCSEVFKEVKISDLLPLPLKAGDRLLFSKNQSGLRFLGEGWSKAEDWGIWSDGTDATLALSFVTERISKILVEANPLLSLTHPKQEVEIKINGIPTNSVTLTTNSGGRFEIEIPEETRQQLKHNGHKLKLQFHFLDAARPVDIGINSDTRKLSIGLVALTIQ